MAIEKRLRAIEEIESLNLQTDGRTTLSYRNRRNCRIVEVMPLRVNFFDSRLSQPRGRLGGEPCSTINRLLHDQRVGQILDWRCARNRRSGCKRFVSLYQA